MKATTYNAMGEDLCKVASKIPRHTYKAVRTKADVTKLKEGLKS